MGDLQRWLQQLPADDRRRAEQIATALRDLGCDDPPAWAGSEVSEGIPQLARYRLLRSVWPEMIDVWEDGVSNLPAARRAVDSGADTRDIARIARAAAYETAFAMLSLAPAEKRPKTCRPGRSKRSIPAGSPLGVTWKGWRRTCSRSTRPAARAAISGCEAPGNRWL